MWKFKPIPPLAEYGLVGLLLHSSRSASCRNPIPKLEEPLIQSLYTFIWTVEVIPATATNENTPRQGQAFAHCVINSTAAKTFPPRGHGCT
jgi:hypothetical protein